ncbi:MAG: isoprenylcysteine carboxylmethyltransferase family protein [Myxococcaceae bacterium]
MQDVIFFAIVLAVAILRIFELMKSNRHRKILLTQGGVEHASGHYKYMVLLHTAWFISMLFEVICLKRPFYFWLFSMALAGTFLGNILRYVSMNTLGVRWNTRIIILPGKAPIQTGIYRYFRHPIYIGVCLELACIPLLHTAYLTAIIFTILNLVLLKTRIREEEKALGITI